MLRITGLLLLVGGILAFLFLPWPWWLVVVILLAVVDGADLLVWLTLRKKRPISGAEGLIGERGTLAGSGRVRIRGTSYRARVVDGPGPAPSDPKDDRVEVVGVEGLTLVVRRVGERA